VWDKTPKIKSWVVSHQILTLRVLVYDDKPIPYLTVDLP